MLARHNTAEHTLVEPPLPLPAGERVGGGGGRGGGAEPVGIRNRAVYRWATLQGDAVTFQNWMVLV